MVSLHMRKCKPSLKLIWYICTGYIFALAIFVHFLYLCTAYNCALPMLVQESRLDAPRPFTLHHYFKPRRQLRSTVVHRGAFCHRVTIRSTVFFLLYFIVFFLDSLCIITNYFVMYLQSGDQFGSVRRW